MCKSVIDEQVIKKEWKDDVYLSEACKERFLTLCDIPEWQRSDVFMAGLAELEQGYFVERESMDVHTLIFTLEGGGILTTPYGEERLEPNSLAVLPTNTSFRIELDTEIGDWKMVWLLPRPTQKWQHLVTINKNRNGRRHFVNDYPQCEQIWSLLMLLHNEIGGRESFRRLLVNETSRLLAGFEAPVKHSLSRVQSLFYDVESQLHLNWTVSGMAKMCFISEEQFNRLCKQSFGMSPRTKLIQLRMDKAAELLRYRDWSIAMIANRLGYKDQYNFTHRFKKYFGDSPSAYRKKHYLQ